MPKHPNQINIVLTNDELEMLETVQKERRFSHAKRQTVVKALFRDALAKAAAKVKPAAAVR